MIIAEIIGTAVSTVKVKNIEGTKLKIAKVINPYYKEEGIYFFVEDAIGVGVGEKVLLVDEGNVVSKIVGRENVPIRSFVVAKIDNINIVVDN